jgi:hypothetical protein
MADDPYEPSEVSEKQVIEEIIQPLDWETLNSFVDSSVEVGHFNRHSESKLKIYDMITTCFHD